MVIKDELFSLAEHYVEETSVSLFITGKAGTGKTTFLKYIVEHTSKRCIVLAPTGVAAVNASGSTIHSFFSLPLCPYLPEVRELVTEYQMPERYRRLKRDKIKIIKTLDLLIIDEVSMVRADLMDAMDMMLRRYRRSSHPFGGVQLLMIGDAQQLSPVVTDAERPYISKVYQSPYFFHSKALRYLPYKTIELRKIYRQEDAEFIYILNAIRDAKPSREVFERINSRVGAPTGDDWIRLVTHNNQADKINRERLDLLEGKEMVYRANVEGDYPESLYPAAAELHLKTGARVMFIRNDSDGRFYNGMLGTVVSMMPEFITIAADNSGEITLSRTEWENLQYSLNEVSGEIIQEIKGSFRQFPLRPAWAITIHKSQGLTFDHVIIDAGAAFAFGQVYVALSRCKTMDGISLTRPLTAGLLMGDADVSSFNATLGESMANESQLSAFRSDYNLELLLECFNFEDLRRQILTLRKIWREASLASLYPIQAKSLEELAGNMITLEETAGKFRRQLTGLKGDPETTAQRVSKACGYFLPIMEKMPLRELLAVELDNAETRKRIKNLSEDLLPQWLIHVETLSNVLSEGFDGGEYRRLRNEILINGPQKQAKPSRKKIGFRNEEKEPEARDIYKDNRHPELVQKLIAWRLSKSRDLNVPAYVILHQKTLLGIADTKPSSREEMLEVKGFGSRLWEKFGSEILEVISGE